MRRLANPWDRFYRHHEAPWRGERPVADLLPWLGPGAVLELGCGNGKLLRPLVASGVPVVGLDISWHALRRLGSGSLVLADAADLPFADGAFTAVLDIHCTGHLGRGARARALHEVRRVLAPGGVVVAERLTPADLRAGQGSAVPGEPDMRVVADGRATAFTGLDALADEYRKVGFRIESGYVERHHPGHGGRQVTRESARVLAISS